MKLSDFSLKELVEFIKGDNTPTVKRSGPELVNVFNANGTRDIYDFDNGGLPKLNGRTMNTSRKDYVFDRLKQINDTINLINLILTVINDSDEELKVTIAADINKIISPEGYKVECLGADYAMIGIDAEEEVEEIEFEFDEIEKQVIAELDKAEFTVWVAMAWFTNPRIHSKLLELKGKGVNVQIITIDDDINRAHGCSINEFEGKRIAQWGNFGTNKMHNKYCIIDSKNVITGSYNWTKAAEYNKENVSILRSKKVAESYNREFIKLKRQ